MKRITPLIMSLTVGSLAIAQSTQRPNIIYVFPDQYRNSAMQLWNEEGFKEKVNFKGDPVHTPVLSRFARESVVLTSAQSNCPLSSPHRGMMLTGMYPDGSGVPLNCNSTRPISNLRIDAVTISDVLSRNGYDCAYFGKLHVDYPTLNNPQHPGTYVDDRRPAWDAYTPKDRRHGFNHWYSYGTYDVHKEPHYWDNEGKRHDINEWSPQHEADMAIQYLTSKRDPKKPFYMVVSMNPPHSPYNTLEDVMEKDYKLYKDIPLSELLVRPNVNTTLVKMMKKTPFYFASVTGVDREFGRILEAVKQLGLEGNTIVVFTSDHGETLSSHVEDPKNSPYTESMNVPFIIRYPGKLEPRVSDLLLSTPDIMPTLLSLVGLKKEIPSAVQGQDLSAYLSGKSLKRNAPKGVLYIRNMDGEKNASNEVISYFPQARGIKTDRYTMAITINRDKKITETLLYDDKNDPYQLHPLDTNANKALIKQLTDRMKPLLKQANDPWYREKVL